MNLFISTLFIAIFIYGILSPLMDIYFAKKSITLSEKHILLIEKIEKKYNEKADPFVKFSAGYKINQNKKTIHINLIIISVAIIVNTLLGICYVN